jgi:hypothetical protein
LLKNLSALPPAAVEIPQMERVGGSAVPHAEQRQNQIAPSAEENIVRVALLAVGNYAAVGNYVAVEAERKKPFREIAFYAVQTDQKTFVAGLVEPVCEYRNARDIAGVAHWPIPAKTNMHGRIAIHAIVAEPYAAADAHYRSSLRILSCPKHDIASGHNRCIRV